MLLADPAPLQRAGLRALLASPPTPNGLLPTATPQLSPPAAVTAGFTNRIAKPEHDAKPEHTTKPERAAKPEHAGMPEGDIGMEDGIESANDLAVGVADITEMSGRPLAEIVVVGETGDGAEALDLARRLLPDVLIVELALPRLDGLAVTRAVGGARLPVRVLVITDRDSDDQIVAAVTAGATGFLSKDAPHADLVTAVRTVAAGGAMIAPKLLARILTRLAEAVPAPPADNASVLNALTGREREVLVHVARGRTNTEIAEILQVSETTVKTHVGHVLTKLRLRDRTQAVVLAYETGLIKPGA
ncbi:LuxR C-terminal-related transcriptional regulator [Actinoplanes sp. CA-015351]|uniref:LuxR C-terminal-related transcriptional regulator n=1 Tax=Actinoplanes sp. CA-015351 TaxID=3239897 RepID=UPI003D9A0707